MDQERISVAAGYKREWRRRVRKGYPKESPFTSIEQVDEYLSGERVTCLLCGKAYKSVGHHIVRLHDVSLEEYHERFGIPWDRGLCAAATSEKWAAAAMTHLDAFLAAGPDARAKPRNYKHPISTVTAQRVNRIKSVCESPATLRQCSKCGKDMTASGSALLRTVALCPECRFDDRHAAMSTQTKERIAAWAEENKERSTEYSKAKNWWGWQRNPLPLLAYAEKWGARLRIMPELVEAAKGFSG